MNAMSAAPVTTPMRMGVFLLLALCLSNFTQAADVLLRGYQVCTVATPGCQEVDVLVRGSVIEAVGARLTVEPGVEIVEAEESDWRLTPGLIDSYSQLGLVEISLERSTLDARVRDYSLGPAFRIKDAINPFSSLIAINRLGGITTAMVFPEAGNDPIAGQGLALSLAENTAAPVIAEPVGMAIVLGRRGARFTGGSRAATLQRLDSAFSRAKRFNPKRFRPAQGDYSAADLLALKDYLRGIQPLLVNTDRASEILAAIAFAQRHSRRLIVFGGAEAWKVADQLAAAKATVAMNPLDNVPYGFDALGARLDNAKILADKGVSFIIVQDDTHNLRRLRYYAGNAAANGLSWDQALAAITLTPAKTWGLSHLGSIAPGKQADLVIWDGDPLDVTSVARKVMIGGVWQPMKSRQTRLLERYKDLRPSRPFGYQ